MLESRKDGQVATVVIVPTEKEHPLFRNLAEEQVFSKEVIKVREMSNAVQERANLRQKTVQKIQVAIAENFAQKDASWNIPSLGNDLEVQLYPKGEVDIEIPGNIELHIDNGEEVSGRRRQETEPFLERVNSRAGTSLLNGVTSDTRNEKMMEKLEADSAERVKNHVDWEDVDRNTSDDREAEFPDPRSEIWNHFKVSAKYPNKGEKYLAKENPYANAEPLWKENMDYDYSDDDSEVGLSVHQVARVQALTVNVTGKIEVGLPDSAFQGRAFKEGQDFVKNMMTHAWNGYKEFAWGEDDLRPWSKKGKNCLGNSPLGLTITDSLDTLHLMGMEEEFREGAEWVFNNLDFDKKSNVVSLFETNIRLLGGFLSNYALKNDTRFLDKARDLGDRFMKNFEGGKVFPSNNLKLNGNVELGRKRNLYRMSGVSVSLAQIGTFSVEFGYLSHVTGNPIYREKALNIISELSKMETTIPGLFPSQITTGSLKQHFENYSLSGEMDSFYEYLLKYWLLSGKQDQLHYTMYQDAVKAIRKHLISNVDGKSYLVSKAYGNTIMQQEHLACFAPGMLGLGAVQENDTELLKLAEDLTESCYLSYHNQEHGVGCEVVSVPSLKPTRNGANYALRPEVIESIFYMWRLTKNPKYRRWGYEIAQNIEAACVVPTGGYSGIKSVNMTPVFHNDHQESFFLAETLKYLYLLFSPDDVIPLDKWVFNTEAHPLPVIQ